MKYNLGWGEPDVVRAAASSVCGFGEHPWAHTVHDSYYPPHTGIDALKEKISAYMLEQSGILYPVDNIFITIGATGALNAAIMAWQKINNKNAAIATNDMYFGFYPNIIKNTGAIHLPFPSIEFFPAYDISIKDSPSNPEGKFTILPKADMEIWDAAYFSPTYIPGDLKSFVNTHDVMVGTASKLLGLSGERVGWLAVRPMSKYEQHLKVFEDVVTHLFCGVNLTGQMIVQSIFPLKSNFGDEFFNKSKAALDANKDAWSQLKHIFDGSLPNEVGMFFLSDVDPAAKKLLDDCGIAYKYGTELGVGGMNKIRINMAANKNVLFQAVKEVLKKDKTFKKVVDETE